MTHIATFEKSRFISIEKLCVCPLLFKMTTAEKNINWRWSAARAMILADLESDTIPLEESDLSAKKAWRRYQGKPEFAQVPFALFKKQLAAHREHTTIKVNHHSKDEELFWQDQRMFFPEIKTHNHKSDPVFDRSR